MKVLVLSTLVGLISVGVNAQHDMSYGDMRSMSQGAPETIKAIAVLSPTQGNNVMGTVTFSAVEGEVKVEASLSGLTPGKHGFHIHQYGDCSAPDATSAGGHFQPTGHMHGSPTDTMHHDGDLGNLIADSTGTANYELVDSTLRLSGVNSIIGLAVIVHASEDDYKTQPTGNSGARVACGVIGRAKY